MVFNACLRFILNYYFIVRIIVLNIRIGHFQFSVLSSHQNNCQHLQRLQTSWSLSELLCSTNLMSRGFVSQLWNVPISRLYFSIQKIAEVSEFCIEPLIVFYRIDLWKDELKILLRKILVWTHFSPSKLTLAVLSFCLKESVKTNIYRWF